MGESKEKKPKKTAKKPRERGGAAGRDRAPERSFSRRRPPRATDGIGVEWGETRGGRLKSERFEHFWHFEIRVQGNSTDQPH
jgi:hypothetical protein